MKNTFTKLALFFVVLSPWIFARSLTVKDHTMVIKFLLENPAQVRKWLRSRGRAGRITPEEVMNFVSKAASTRSNSDLADVAKRTISIANSRTRVPLPVESTNLIGKIRSAKTLAEVQSVLVQATSLRKSPASSGAKFALEIIKDGLRNGIYSMRGYSAYIAPKRRRGIWAALADEVLDTAKNDAVGAIIGAVIGPEGAVAGAIASSSSSVAETLLNLVLGNPEPAY